MDKPGPIIMAAAIIVVLGLVIGLLIYPRSAPAPDGPADGSTAEPLDNLAERARACRVDADCVLVHLPRCQGGCRPGPCGTIAHDELAAVNRALRDRYLARLEQRERAACRDIICLACAQPTRPPIPPLKGKDQGQPLPQAICLHGTCMVSDTGT